MLDFCFYRGNTDVFVKVALAFSALEVSVATNLAVGSRFVIGRIPMFGLMQKLEGFVRRQLLVAVPPLCDERRVAKRTCEIGSYRRRRPGFRCGLHFTLGLGSGYVLMSEPTGVLGGSWQAEAGG